MLRCPLAASAWSPPTTPSVSLVSALSPQTRCSLLPLFAVSAISENAEKLQMGFVHLLELQLPHIALIHFLWMAVRFL